MGSASENIRRKREALWTRDPRCHWCGVTTIPPRPDSKGRLPDTAATYDHLRSRIDRRLGLNASLEGQYVLACRKCNEQRGQDQQRELTEAGRGKLRRRPAKAKPVPLAQIRLEQLEYSEMLEKVQQAISAESSPAWP